RLGQGGRGLRPDTGQAPAAEAPPDAVPVAISLRHIAPRGASAQAPQNAIDGRPPVLRRPPAPALHRRQHAIQNAPLRVAQIPSAQDCLPRICSLESNRESRVNLLSTGPRKKQASFPRNREA